MIGSRRLTAAVLAVALVFASVSPALAMHRGNGGVGKSPYRVAKPRVVSSHVAVGTSFEASGVITPAIAADDTSASVAIEVYRPEKRGRLTLVTTVPAAFSSVSETVTAYSGTVVLPEIGAYVLVAAVSRDGVVVSRSSARPVFADPAYRVTKPHVARHKVGAGAAFDATGVVLPVIGVDELATTVELQVFKVGRHGALTAVGTFAALLTPPAVEGDGTGYAASVTIAEAGKYIVRAVVMKDGVVMGRSGKTELRVRVTPAPEPAPEPEPEPVPEV